MILYVYRILNFNDIHVPAIFEIFKNFMFFFYSKDLPAIDPYHKPYQLR